MIIKNETLSKINMTPKIEYDVQINDRLCTACRIIKSWRLSGSLLINSIRIINFTKNQISWTKVKSSYTKLQTGQQF